MEFQCGETSNGKSLKVQYTFDILHFDCLLCLFEKQKAKPDDRDGQRNIEKLRFFGINYSCKSVPGNVHFFSFLQKSEIVSSNPIVKEIGILWRNTYSQSVTLFQTVFCHVNCSESIFKGNNSRRRTFCFSENGSFQWYLA